MIGHNTLVQDLSDAFPFLASSGEEVNVCFLSQAVVRHIPTGMCIASEGMTCTHLPLVLSGGARIYKVGESGREITLYRIERGETCILTASCIMSQTPFPAFAVAEHDMQAVIVPASLVRHWMDHSDAWRTYVFGLVAQRLTDVMTVIEEVAFRPMAGRIATYLCTLAQRSGAIIHTTHRDIATELGTSREVVSRLLRDLASEGLITVARGAILIEDADTLQQKAEKR